MGVKIYTHGYAYIFTTTIIIIIGCRERVRDIKWQQRSLEEWA